MIHQRDECVHAVQYMQIDIRKNLIKKEIPASIQDGSPTRGSDPQHVPRLTRGIWTPPPMSTVVLSAPNVTMASEAIHVIVEKTFISYKRRMEWQGVC